MVPKGGGRGLINAQLKLGMIYYFGEGVNKNYKEGIKWLYNAAIQNDSNSQLLLGLIYIMGEGVVEDYIEAYKWLLLAGMNGEDVTKWKSLLQNNMTSGQIFIESQRIR